MALNIHPIQVASRMTGLTAHVIRMWEKRYGAVSPNRTESNRRLYSAEDIERLRLLAQATAAGSTIRNLAPLPNDELRRVIAAGGGEVAFSSPAPKTEAERGAGSRSRRGDAASSADLVREAVEATRRFDAEGLEVVLKRGEVQHGHNGLLVRLISPLAVELGNLWQSGQLTAAHEHFATALIRGFLARHARPYADSADGPCAIVATPSGQLHELGAVMVSALARNLGWHVVYLGTSLPAAEIAGAALQNQARAVILSIIYPPDDARLAGELQHLRGLLPTDVTVLAGGRAAGAYSDTLHRIGAQRPESLDELAGALDELRLPAPATVTA
ncbi:MAG: MerR family transcriptional regulator [Limisphaerales bacterium]